MRPEPRPAEFDPAALDAWLKRHVAGCAGPMRLQRIGGGQSNPTFFVDYEGRRMVLRKQPAGPVLPSAHAVDREYRIMAALAATDVPVPAMLAFCEDREVVGTPFYVMERVEGRVFDDCALPGVAPAERRAMYLDLAATLAKLHRVDVAALGLADYGRPGDFFERQIGRWTKQWALSKTREIPEIDRIAEWLAANRPASTETAISHGDYRVGNVMFHPTEPRIVAVLDWELSTLGHPLADLAFSCLAWHTRPEWFGGLLGTDFAALGIPSQDDYVAHYCRLAGRTDGIGPFHIVFSLFRFAVILEGIAVRARAGNAAADNAAEVGDKSVLFARRAVDVIDGGL